MAARPTKIGARDPKTGKWHVLWTDNVYRPAKEKPVTAHVDDIDVLTDGNAIRTSYGMCTPWNGDRPR